MLLQTKGRENFKKEVSDASVIVVKLRSEGKTYGFSI